MLRAGQWGAKKKKLKNSLFSFSPSLSIPFQVVPSCYHVCHEKATNYFEIEMRVAPLKKDRYWSVAEDLLPLVDESTIGVVCILGSTYTGHFDDVAGISKALEEYNARNPGHDVGLHVDGASGGETRMFFVVVVSCLCRNCAPDTQLSESISPQNQTHTHSPKKQKKGFIAPFIYPDLEWDFRLKNVKSINVSGHKYGLVYAGVGW